MILLNIDMLSSAGQWSPPDILWSSSDILSVTQMHKIQSSQMCVWVQPLNLGD